MKKPFLHPFFMIFLAFVIPTTGGISTAFAQTDSVRITHSQETGTLEKQRFIDQYDYVFMTKEPTKWMVKVYSSLQNVRASNLLSSGYSKKRFDVRFGAEHKIIPSLSITLDVSRNNVAPLGNQQPDYSNYFFSDNKRWVASTGMRWYYDMTQRIKEGISSTAFSGNYFSVRYEKAWNNELYTIGNSSELVQKGHKEYINRHYNSQISLLYGIQRRFFRHGLLDFSLSLNCITNRQVRKTITFLDGNDTNNTPSNVRQTAAYTPERHWNLTTDLKLGLALADFRKATAIANSNVFQSFEDEIHMWKIDWPRIKMSSSSQLLDGSFGYEQKIARSSFSINTYLNFSFSNHIRKNAQLYDSVTYTFFTGDSRNTGIEGLLCIQPRWYFLMHHLAGLGKSGNDLSGIYTGLNTIFLGMHGTSTNNRYKLSYGLKPSFVSTGLMVGYQRKLFNRGFMDLNISKGLINDLSNYNYLVGNSKLIFDFKLGFAL